MIKRIDTVFESHSMILGWSVGLIVYCTFIYLTVNPDKNGFLDVIVVVFVYLLYKSSEAVLATILLLSPWIAITYSCYR